MKRLFSLIVLFSFISCGGKESIPDSVLPIEKMVDVQVGIHLLEAEQGQRTIDQTLNGADTFSFQTVFVKEKITKSQYDSSMIFYTAHPKLLDEVYDKVINELNKMQAEEKKKNSSSCSGSKKKRQLAVKIKSGSKQLKSRQ